MISETLFLILKNQSIWPTKIIVFYIREYKIPSKAIYFL